MLEAEEAGINAASLKLARESAVLLKNEKQVLPLKDHYKKIALIGYHAADRYAMLGDYTPAYAGEFLRDRSFRNEKRGSGRCFCGICDGFRLQSGRRGGA